MSHLYKIRDWKDRFENNRTRDLVSLTWVPIPNRHDGDAYTIIMSRPDGAAIYGAWVATVQVASRCAPRGTLLRDCKKPHDAGSLSRMTRFPEEVMQAMLNLLASEEISWLEVEQFANESTNPAHSCGDAAPDCVQTAPSCLEGKGMEGKKDIHISGNRLHKIPASEQEVIDYGATLHPKVTEDRCRAFWSYYEGQARTNENGAVFWVTGGGENASIITNWKAKLPSFSALANQRAMSGDTAPSPDHVKRNGKWIHRDDMPGAKI